MISLDDRLTLREVEALSRELYGGLEVASRRGVVHVTALYAAGDGRLGNIRIGPEAPSVAEDRFALELGRARAEAILVTGQILRDEPELSYTPPPVWADALAAFRRERVGLVAPPRLMVLTRGEIDLDHPALSGLGARPLILTGHGVATRLGEAARGRGVEVAGLDAPGGAAAIDWARRAGAKTIVLEAGPRTTVPLHAAGRVDELALSVFHGAVSPEARGALAFDAAALEAALGPGTKPARVESPAGLWTFQLLPAQRPT